MPERWTGPAPEPRRRQLNWDFICANPGDGWVLAENVDYRTTQKNIESHANAMCKRRGMKCITRRIAPDKVWILPYSPVVVCAEATEGEQDGAEGGSVGDEGLIHPSFRGPDA